VTSRGYGPVVKVVWYNCTHAGSIPGRLKNSFGGGALALHFHQVPGPRLRYKEGGYLFGGGGPDPTHHSHDAGGVRTPPPLISKPAWP